jgi:hypothetical protein
MSSNLLGFITFILSFSGLVILVLRKVPLLTELSKNAESLQEGDISKLKNFTGLKSFSWDFFLQKAISRIRVLSLKTDTKTFNWLKNLRERNQKEKLGNENYWEEIKKSTEDEK